ncbi:hypothetical protein, partial [Alcaligenes faecalis]|uniref:hypothetical protein n=1 Tax=Alcaligenes faecalis TaxID=511 RepID=UPI002041E153
MSKDAVLTLFDDMRKRALGINDKTDPRTGFLFSMLPVGLPLNAEDFRNPWSPALKNLPKPQDPQELAKVLEEEHRAQNALLSLSQFVNFKLSTDGTGTIMPANTRVSDTWKLILDSASPSPNRPAPNPAAVQRVRDAEAYLRDKHDDTADSAEYKRYKAKKTAYDAAVLAYTADYQNAMKTPESAAAWPVSGTVSLAKVDDAYNDWIALGHKDDVEERLNTIAAQGKDAVEAVIAMAKKKFDPYQLALGVIVDKTPYVQIFPSDWAEPNSEDSGWTTFGYSESDISTTHSDESTSWGASGGFSFGFWSVRAGGGSSQRE